MIRQDVYNHIMQAGGEHHSGTAFLYYCIEMTAIKLAS